MFNSPRNTPDYERLLQQAADAKATGDATTCWNLLRACLALDPADFRPYWFMGLILHDGRKFAASAAAFRRALEVDRGQPSIWSNLGWNLHLTGRCDEALSCLDEAARLAPGWWSTWVNRSQLMVNLGRLDEALADARKAVDCQNAGDVDGLPSMAMALAHLYRGEWAEGFRWYEGRVRYRMPEWAKYPYPVWRGEKVDRLFVQSEQGLGDEIMCLRWLPEAARRAGRVVYYCHREARRLVETCFALPENVQVMPMPAPVPPADAWCPGFSLPNALGRECLEPLWTGPYLKAPVAAEFPAARFNVGIAWGGDPAQESDHLRSVSLARFLRFLEIPEVTLYSLQVGKRVADLDDVGAHGLVVDLMPRIQDLADTCGLIAGLDLVVTVCTSVAHLASAMGKPCLLLVPRRGAFWIYQQRAGKDWTPWYPGTEVIRQKVDGDWDEVFGWAWAMVGKAMMEKAVMREASKP